mmetsp:Transcript_37637/g.118876  ORF Transcript_37637/g.118876 Transcript_37637/m.118876 type:complete len:423 (-) Transcript_37637:35-1303(-)
MKRNCRKGRRGSRTGRDCGRRRSRRRKESSLLSRIGGLCRQQGCMEAIRDEDYGDEDMDAELLGEEGGGGGGAMGYPAPPVSRQASRISYVHKQESDGIAEMSFAGFDMFNLEEENSNPGSDEDGDSEDDEDEEDELVRAIADFAAERPHEISLKVGQVLLVLNRHDSGWWEGCLACGEGRSGWFPSNHVQLLPRQPRRVPAKHEEEEEEEEEEKQGEEEGKTGKQQFLPGLDYRNASWADDSHALTIKREKIDYREASWAEPLGEEEEEGLDEEEKREGEAVETERSATIASLMQTELRSERGSSSSRTEEAQEELRSLPDLTSFSQHSLSGSDVGDRLMWKELTPVACWGLQEIRRWLDAVELAGYADKFQDVGGAELVELMRMESEEADERLQQWGIPNKYHRKRFLKKLSLLSETIRD